MALRNLLTIAAIIFFTASSQATPQDQCRYAGGHVHIQSVTESISDNGYKYRVLFRNDWQKPVNVFWHFSDREVQGFRSPIRVPASSTAYVDLTKRGGPSNGRAEIINAIDCN